MTHSDQVMPKTEMAGDQYTEVSITAGHTGGQRLDSFLAQELQEEGITRSRVQQLIKSSLIVVNGSAQKAKYAVQKGDLVHVNIPAPAPLELVPQKIDFPILHEDDDLLVLAKPPGLVVHPSCGHGQGTLVHGLLFHCRDLSGINGTARPGIVHRLDKDTSGVMVVAKNDTAHHSLVEQFKDRGIEKVYHALVLGTMRNSSGTVDQPIGRHPVKRKKMCIREDGRNAVTHWHVLERFRHFTLLEIQLETGRTHQIRVHMAALGHSIAGDAVYGKSNKQCAALDITRQLLHASRLCFHHPRSHERLCFEAPLWQDIEQVVGKLRQQESQ